MTRHENGPKEEERSNLSYPKMQALVRRGGEMIEGEEAERANLLFIYYFYLATFSV